MPQPLERSTPEQAGIPSQALLDFIQAVESEIQYMHSFVLLRHGRLVAQGAWSPYALENPHILYSLSKSFTATAVGLAIAEGRLGLDDPVISFFPDDLPAEISPNLAAMRVRHLLSMATGHANDTSERMRDSAYRSWEAGFLALPVEFAPGTHFTYNNGATFMLSAIVQKLAGEPLTEYLTPRLFAPLGIQKPSWEANFAGVNLGYKGLRLAVEDVARFGQLYLNGGVWQGMRLLDEAWVDMASCKQVDNAGPGAPVDWSQGYGFQFWRCQNNAYRGDGAFGQFCVIMPEQQAVLAVHGGMEDMQPVLDLVWRHLLPAMQPGSLAPKPEAQAALDARLQSLKIPAPGAAGLPSEAQSAIERLSGKLYRFEPNYLGIDALRITQSAGRLRLASGSRSYDYGLGDWLPGTQAAYLPWRMEMKMSTGLDDSDLLRRPMKTASSAAWVEPNQLVLTTRFVETPFTQTITCTFEGDQLKLQETAHVSFGPLEGPLVTGRIEENR